jgi:nicotinate-nucleotide pyrophosphorylase (carboxylating)
MNLLLKGLERDMQSFFAEDDLATNAFYLQSLPSTEVECTLKIKSDLLLAGLPYFVSAFNALGADLNYDDFKNHEGKFFLKGSEIKFHLPFSLALSGERVALNLLGRASAVASFTQKFVAKAEGKNIKILDTRKTTPGLRSLEKYAVRIGGGFNHRFSQADVWMIKDNHKNVLGGLKGAYAFFQHLHTPYQNIIVEIHSLEELAEAIELGVKHVMLDNFSESQLIEAIKMKMAGMTYEISGGVNLENCEKFFLKGIDAVSIGALTHSAPHVDLSLKMRPL